MAHIPDWSRVAVVAALAVGVAHAAPVQQRIRSGIELVAVDVQVVGRDGTPVTKLTPADFEVAIDGKSRPVVSSDFIDYTTAAISQLAPGAKASAANRVVAESPGGAIAPRRMFVFAVDEHSLRLGSNKVAIMAAKRFIDRLGPGDLVGLQAYPTGVVHADLTTDHEAVKRALEGIASMYERPVSFYRLSASEVIDIDAGDRDALARVVDRECHKDLGCPRLVALEAHSLAIGFEARVEQSLGGLRGVIRALGDVPGRKTMVLVSGGLMTNDRGTGRVEMSTRQMAVGREAIDANVTLYALHLDDSFLDAFSSRGQQSVQATSTLFRDSGMFASGLELVAGAAGGEVFRVESTSPDRAMDRILLETSAYYLVAVEPTDADRDGKTHQLRVRVKARGATVRSRPLVTIPRKH